MDLVISILPEDLESWVNDASAVNLTFTGPRPKTRAGARLYVLCEGRLKGWVPISAMKTTSRGWAVSKIGALHLTAWELPWQDATLQSGVDLAPHEWRHRWWKRKDELAY